MMTHDDDPAISRRRKSAGGRGIRLGGPVSLPTGTDRLTTARLSSAVAESATVEALKAIQPHKDSPTDALVFGLQPRRLIVNRIRAAAHAAGLRRNFKESRPRIGMAADADRAGIRLSALEVTRRWHDALMPDLVTAVYYGRDIEE